MRDRCKWKPRWVHTQGECVQNCGETGILFQWLVHWQPLPTQAKTTFPRKLCGRNWPPPIRRLSGKLEFLTCFGRGKGSLEITPASVGPCHAGSQHLLSPRKSRSSPVRFSRLSVILTSLSWVLQCCSGCTQYMPQLAWHCQPRVSASGVLGSLISLPH